MLEIRELLNFHKPLSFPMLNSFCFDIEQKLVNDQLKEHSELQIFKYIPGDFVR